MLLLISMQKTQRRTSSNSHVSTHRQTLHEWMHEHRLKRILLLYLLSLSLYENTHTVRRIRTAFLHYSHIISVCMDMNQRLSNFYHSRRSLSNRASTLRVFKVQLHNSSFSDHVRIISVNFDMIRFCAKRPILIRSCPASMHLVRQ